MQCHHTDASNISQLDTALFVVVVRPKVTIKTSGQDRQNETDYSNAVTKK